MLGLWVRAHQPFELPLNEHLKRWEGFPPELAHQMVIYERTGLKPKTITAVEGGHAIEVSHDEGPGPRDSVLKAGHTEGPEDLCKSLEPDNWNNNPKNILNYYQDRLASDELYRAIRTKISALKKEDQQMQALEAARKLICQLKGDAGQ